MNQITIRKATLNDIETLLVFEQGVITAERPYDPTLKPGLIHYYNLPELITSPHSELLVAELDNTLIGSGYARIEKSKDYNRHDQYAYMGFMYTDPKHRGKGVNRKIIEGLKYWTSQQGIYECRLEVYSDNISAIRAYEKVGFNVYMVEMRAALNS